MAETINGYELDSSFHNENAGYCQWTTAHRNGARFFIKKFLNPVYPDEDTLSPKMRETRIQECLAFADEKKRLYEAVNLAGDGNIVRILDFFRCGSHYYMVSDLVEDGGGGAELVDALSREDRLLLCLSVAHSVANLHLQGIVHSDIKETNVLLKRTRQGKLVGKLIDFDCGFFVANPPRSMSDFGGDLVYMSPEACKFACGESVSFTGKMDVFAMGLLFHKYLTGALPAFDESEFDYINEVVLDEGELTLSPALDEPAHTLISRMLLCDDAQRIDSMEVFEALREMLSPNVSNPEAPTGAEQPVSTGWFHAPGDL